MSDDQSPGPLPVNLPARIDYIDGLRGVAIGLVLLCHAWQYGHYTIVLGHLHFGVTNPLDFVASAGGRNGVGLFLLLSGFCLSYPVWKRRREGAQTWFQASQFFARRSLRILPPYYMALVLSILLIVVVNALDPRLHFGTIPSTGNLLAHIVLIHNLTPYSHLINGTFWSLGLEWQWYFLFPVLLLLCMRRPVATVTVCVLVSVVWNLVFRWLLAESVRPGLIQALRYPLLSVYSWRYPVYVHATYAGRLLHYEAVHPGTAFFLHHPWLTPYVQPWLYAVPSQLTEFACGILAAHLVVAGRRLPLPLLAGAALATMIVAEWPGGYNSVLGYSLLYPLHAVTFSALVLLGSQVPAVNRILSWKPLMGLGVISYSVYLTHLPFITLISSLLPASLRPSYWLMPIFIAPALAVGTIFHLLIERPVMRRGTWRRFGSHLTLPFRWTDAIWTWISGPHPHKPARDATPSAARADV